MIYVIQSAGYDSKGQFIDLVNIRYVLNDGDFEKSLKESNPSARILFKDSCNDFRIIEAVSDRFKEYALPNRQGWFIYNEGIIQFFKDKVG